MRWAKPRRKCMQPCALHILQCGILLESGVTHTGSRSSPSASSTLMHPLPIPSILPAPKRISRSRPPVASLHQQHHTTDKPLPTNEFVRSALISDSNVPTSAYTALTVFFSGNRGNEQIYHTQKRVRLQRDSYSEKWISVKT